MLLSQKKQGDKKKAQENILILTLEVDKEKFLCADIHANMYARYLFLLYATNTVLVLYGVKHEKKILISEKFQRTKI